MRYRFSINFLIIAIAAICVLFYSSYKLFNSPETWLDEGLIIQSAIGLLNTGEASLPIAPGIYEPSWYITTGFPVTAPLAAIFSYFGASIESARILMFVFICAFYIALFIFAKRAIIGAAAIFGFFFIVFFGPVYGHGRNVLGEIPGLLFVLLSLLPLLNPGVLTWRRALLVGLGAGLAFATKPIFILFFPALLIVLFLRRKELELGRVFIFGVIGVCIPVLVWIVTQFDSVSLARIFAVYSNPHDINIVSAIATNIKRIFTEAQPLYFVGALFIWTTSYVVRRVGRISVSLTEEALLIFSILILIAHLRNAGYYRYFFPGQVFALLYLPQSLWYLATRHSANFVKVATVALCALLAFQAYETSFKSWTAVHYNSERTGALRNYFEELPDTQDVFIYQAPETFLFASGHQTYQYVRITPSIEAGRVQEWRASSGEATLVITPTEFYENHRTDTFSHYTISRVLDNYVILTPTKTKT